MDEKLTLASYWDKLTVEYKRFIFYAMKHSGLKTYVRTYARISMGALIFVPVKYVIRELKSHPRSAWTEHLLYVAMDMDNDCERWLYAQKHTAYQRSQMVDAKMCEEILKILDPPKPEPPSKLEEQLKAWSERNSKG